MAIKQRHPVREAVSALSSGRYYDEVSHWWGAVKAELMDFGYFLVNEDCPLIHNQEGYSLVGIVDLDGKDTGCCLRYSWYRMPSFRWELIGYIT